MPPSPAPAGNLKPNSTSSPATQNALDFIRALKAPTDPPRQPGPSKIDIAYAAWHSDSFYMPNKAETIVEWILTRLLKDKGKDALSSPALDIKYWSLLQNILLPQSVLQIQDKAWLIPLLSRIPIAPIVVFFISTCSQHAAQVSEALELAACSTLSALWPLAVSKLSAESLLECAGAFFSHWSSCDEVGNVESKSSRGLGSLVISSYRVALPNASNKKKLYSSFLVNCLASWLQCTAGSLADQVNVLYYSAGAETLFSVDALRSFQEQHAAASFEKTLAGIASARPDIILRSLPRLLQSYGQAQTKHRASLYGQGSKQNSGSTTEQARSATIEFFAMCEALLSHIPENEDVWKTRDSLLLVVGDEGFLNRMDQASTAVLRRMAETAITSLASLPQDAEAPKSMEAILATLTTLTRIDYDVVSFGLPRVLPTLITAPSGLASSGRFLQQLMDYHTKTRTMDVYVDATLEAVFALSPTKDTRSLYAASLSGPLLHHSYLDSLSRSVRSYLTPGQVSETTQSIARHLATLLEDWQSSSSSAKNQAERPKKKRKVDTPSDDAALSALKFSLVARIAAVILPALPLHSLLPDAQQQVQTAVHELIGSISSILRNALRAIEKSDDSWSWQLLSIAILHLRYRVATASELLLTSEREEKLLAKMLSCLGVSHVTPELRVVILRSLLYELSRGHCDAAPVFDAIVDTLDCDATLLDSRWSGRLHAMGDGGELSVAVLRLLSDRWLPMFDQLASDEHVSRFTRSLLSGKGIEVDPHSTPSLSRGTLLRLVLHDAQFWELNRLRDALLRQIAERTALLDDIKASGGISDLDLKSLRASYEAVLYVPQECLSREVQSTLLRRAVSADSTMLAVSYDSSMPYDAVLLFVYLRSFILNVITWPDVEQESMLQYCLVLMNLPPLQDANLDNITTSLITKLIQMTIGAATKRDSAHLSAVLKVYLETPREVSREDITFNSARMESLSILLYALTVQHSSTQFSDSIIQSLRQVQEDLFVTIITRLKSQSEKHDSFEDISTLRMWNRVLALRRWLDVDISQTPIIAASVTSRIFASGKASSSSQSCPSILAIALEELRLPLPDRPQHLTFIVAAYLAFTRTRISATALDEPLVKGSKSMQVADFDGILDAVADGLQDMTLSVEDLMTLVHLSGVLLQNSPEGTLKVVQKHLSRCLSVFINRATFTEESSLTHQMLVLLAKYCSDRPAAIRFIDVSAIWSVIDHCLAGSTTHDPSTHKAIFQEIVSVINALVRLRRDLILPTLPLLGFSLHKLTLILRTLSPNLGATQSKLVADTLPQWVNATDPVSAEESKALARLLTTLTTKTIIRTHTLPNNEMQKADSLARPFSKHAAHVLSAYLAALNDPLCVMSLAIRKELEPGLFALCETMGEQNRDALMVTLNAGEKAVMKGLWRAYEKQRYVGKG